MSIQETQLAEIAAAIRSKLGTTAKIQASQFAEKIRSIDISLPTLTNPGAAADLRSGKQLISQNKSIITGSMPDAGAIYGDLGVTGGASWNTSGDTNRGSGTVTIKNVKQTAGYTAGYSGSGTLTVNVPANRLLKGRTVTPTTATQTIANAEDIAYGAISVAGDPNLIPANIVSGKSIFGVNGTASTGGSAELLDVRITQTYSSATLTIIPTKSISSISFICGTLFLTGVLYDDPILGFYINRKENDQVCYGVYYNRSTARLNFSSTMIRVSYGPSYIVLDSISGGFFHFGNYYTLVA